MNDVLYQRLCDKDSLYLAWQRVKLKDTFGGIDRVTVEQYAVKSDENLEDLLSQLQSGKYIQQPYKEVFIPKNETEKRKLGLLSVNDKIVQTAVYQLLEPIFEKVFLNVSYGYRSKKGAVKAIHKVRHLIGNEKYLWLASCDIDNFFDTIPHAVLFGRLRAFLKDSVIVELLKMFVAMGSVDKQMRWKDSKKGIPQGGVVSPLLANFYLNPLDKLMVEKKYGFVRYADDFVILGKSEDEAKSALKEAVELLTEKLQLSLNEGTEIISVNEGFEFLGIYFKGQQITITNRKYNHLVSKLTAASRLGTGLVTTKLKEVIRGINQFYCKLLPQEPLLKLDSELLIILKSRIEELQPGKKEKEKMTNEINQLEFFSQKNNFRRKEFIRGIFSSVIENEKTRSRTNVRTPFIKSNKAVIKRKHEYQKLETAGFDLLLSTPGLMVGKRENKIIVKKKGIVVEEVPILNLKNVTVLSEGILFSSNVVHACAENRISIDFLKHDGLPYAILHNPIYNEAKTGLGQLEAYKNDKSSDLVRHFVYGKITNQSNLIKYYGKYYLKRNKDFARDFEVVIHSLKDHANSVMHLRCENLDTFRQSIFGVEGQASASYWELLSHIINIKVLFTKRERQGASDLVNCMLNYGYGILYARVSEAIIKARLNPNLSYLHKPENNRPSLVFDLIEEFRQQAVDRVIIAIITKSKGLKVTDGQLEERTKKLVASKVIERLNAIEKFRKREMRLFEIIQFQAQTLAKYFESDSMKYKPYIRKW